MEEKISGLFTNAANSCNLLYKEGILEIESSRSRGKKDVFQESLNWMIKSHEGDLKFIRVDQLLYMLRNQNH